MLSEQLVKELQTIIREEYGQDLELAHVSKIGDDLVGYFDLLAEIHHRDQTE